MSVGTRQKKSARQHKKLNTASRDKPRGLVKNDDSTVHTPYSVHLPQSMSSEPLPSSDSSQLVSSTNVISAGALAVDLACDYKLESRLTEIQAPQLGTSNPAVITQSLGGVGQNIARAMHYLGTSVRLCCAIGEDAAGFAALAMLNQSGMQVAGVQQIGGGARTAQYVAISDAKKDLMFGMADMKIQELVSEEFDNMWKPQLELVRPRWLVVDSNWSPQAIRKWITTGKSLGAKVAFEPVSAAVRLPFPSISTPISRTARIRGHVSLASALKTYFALPVFVHKEEMLTRISIRNANVSSNH